MPLAQGRRRTGAWVAATALLLLLAGCDTATFTADVGTDAPADSQVARVQVNLLGLEFRRDDGTTTTLEFNAAEPVDLFDLQAGDPLRLFTDEELPVGRYSGVRLLFDDDQDDSVVTRSAGGEFPLRLAEGAFATVDFAVVEEERSQEDLTLMLDLRQSLSFDEAADEYTLTPRLRVVRTAEAAMIEGAVTADCPVGTSLATGGAVYLFPGKGVAVDDLDGAAAEPLATTRVTETGFSGFTYALRFLPAGNYTLALTCRGDQDALGEDDDLDFRNVRDVELDEGEVLQRNLE
jgi:hypothetical protein